MSNPIRKLRIERAWSQEQLAEMSGLSVRTVQRAENGAPSGLETLKSLAAVFEVNLDTLRSEEQAEHQIQPEDTTMQEQTLIPANDGQKATSLELTIRRTATLALFLGMLVMVNYITSPQYYWVQWPALGFGMGILGMWMAWLNGYQASEEPTSKEPKSLGDMFKTTGILLLSALAIFILNKLFSPGIFWSQWALAAIALSTLILWLRWANKK